jgi:sugar phosphate isomerase/epimerase
LPTGHTSAEVAKFQEENMKIGLYASMFGKDDPPALESVESYIDCAYELRLDLIDFRRDRGFSSKEPAYLFDIKLKCLRRGLSIGYLASRGHFRGTDEELRHKVEQAREDVDVALFLGAPMIRLFTGPPLESREEQRREIDCFQQVAQYAATRGLAVGLQNHPSTGDDVLRILAETDRPNFTFILDTGQWVGSPARNKGIADPHIDIYRFMEQTAPYAAHVRAKFYKIDSGREEWLDYERIVGILAQAGYNGSLSIVFEGQDLNACGDKEVVHLAAAHLRDVVGRAGCFHLRAGLPATAGGGKPGRSIRVVEGQGAVQEGAGRLCPHLAKSQNRSL